MAETCDSPASPPNQVCIEIDQDLCPNADFDNAIIVLNHYAYYDVIYDQYWGGYGDLMPADEKPTYFHYNKRLSVDSRIVSSATDKTVVDWKNRYVEGYEINFGFWSKDSYRRYTYAELFEWKYGRPPTEEEWEAITDSQAKSWFNQRHTVHRLLYDDPPRDVKCIEPPIKQFCFDLSNPPDRGAGYTFTGEYSLSGSIEFANGVKCKLKTKNILTKNYDKENSPHRVKMVIQKPCAVCDD